MKKYIIPVILTILLIGTAIALTGEETMTRTGPSTVQPGTSFQVTYTAVGATPPWFISLEDSVSGGCQFPAGDTLRTVMLSDEGNTKQITITAPSSEGTCIFHGDYMYGDFPALNFADLTVSVSGDAPPCTDTCSSLGFECGTQTVCGQSVDCGTCPAGETCTAGICEVVEYQCWMLEDNECVEYNDFEHCMATALCPPLCTTLEACEEHIEVCCKIYGLGIEMEEVNVHYEFMEASECSVPEGFDGGGRDIVENKYCECGGFLIGDFCLKWWMILVAGGLILIFLIKKKK